jgi:hypothetical protein
MEQYMKPKKFKSGENYRRKILDLIDTFHQPTTAIKPTKNQSVKIKILKRK